MTDDPTTIAIYDARADEYAGMTDADAAVDPSLEAFMAACPEGGHVLDLGCGPGASAAAMAQAGFQVTATDASAEMVAMAARHPGVTAFQATFDQITDVAAYDGIWANFSLLHLPSDAFAPTLAALHRATKPGGAFHIGMKLGTGTHRDTLGRLYSYYSHDALNAHLGQAGFAPLSHITGHGKGLDGSMSDWICILSRA